MSEPIIIETPAPPTRERLVLVPPESVSIVRENGTVIGLSIRANDARDATPADLARGGYGKLPMWVTSAADGQKLIGERDEARAAFLGCAQAIGIVCQADGHADEPGPPAAVIAAIKELAKRVEDLESELATANEWRERWCRESEAAAVQSNANWQRAKDLEARAEKAEGLLIQRETELRLAREDGAAVERQMREARSAADASFVRANRAEMRAEKAERELAAERDTLRAELARLTAPGEGEPTDEELRAVHGRACGGATADGDTRALCIARRALWRGGVAHERAKGHSVGCKCGRRSPATKDEDATIDAAQDAGWQVDGVNDCTEDMCPKCQRARLTAPGEGTNEATVRQERCLVAQAVGMGADLHVVAHGGADERQVTVAKGRHMQRAYAAPAEVPSTLARLLGEVSRG